MEDALRKTVDEIHAKALALGLVVYYGWLHEEREHAVHWNEEHGGDWTDFLQCAQTLGAKVIYLDWAPFEDFQVDDALADLENELAEDQISGSDKSELEARYKQLEKYRERVGLTAVIDLAFVSQGVSHICQIRAEWFRTFEELTPEDEEDEGGQVEQDEKFDKALVDKWARALANHTKYSSCKNDDQREYLLEELAREEFGDLPLWPVLRRAETVYLLDVRPREEEHLGSQARELRKQGLNMNAIARKLGISRDRVSGLLAEGSARKRP